MKKQQFGILGALALLVIIATAQVHNAQPYQRAIVTSIPSADSISAAGGFATTQSVTGTSLVVGSILEIHAHGIYTTTATANPLATFQVNGGGTSGLCPVTASLTLSISQTNAPWDIVCYVQINTVGNPGTAIAWGQLNTFTAAGGQAARGFVNAAAVSYITTSAQTASIQEVATLVAGQTFTLQTVYVNQLF